MALCSVCRPLRILPRRSASAASKSLSLFPKVCAAVLFLIYSSSPLAKTVGTGFFINAAGDVVTNFHVVDGCYDIRIAHGGETSAVGILAVDKNNDLAVLKSGREVESYARPGVVPLKHLTAVYAFGFPYGTAMSSTMKSFW